MLPDGTRIAVGSNRTGDEEFWTVDVASRRWETVPLFPTRISTFANPFRTSYAVASDGQRFLINTLADDASTPSITVVVNWTALLKR